MRSNELSKDLEGNCCKLHTLTNNSVKLYNMKILQLIYFPNKNEKLRYLFYSTSVDPEVKW
jgi:hypothetical protein